jgi:hypothetical protein
LINDAGESVGGHVAEPLQRHPVVVVVQRKAAIDRDLDQGGAVSRCLQQPVGDSRGQLASAQRRPAVALRDVGERDRVTQHLGHRARIGARQLGERQPDLSAGQRLR